MSQTANMQQKFSCGKLRLSELATDTKRPGFPGLTVHLPGLEPGTH
jgi:hypothetical protein